MEQPAERITDLLIEEEMKDSYLTYAMSVIVSRALPDVRDGLKPSQRRILTAMNDLNLGPRAKFRKCAKIAGDTSGNYHPHGEQVIYPTLVRMAQPFSMRYMLVSGQGNFGSIDGDPPAAMRYTEARLSGPAVELLEDIDKDTVDFVANYDETRQEPTVLPSKFPNLLCNGASGIAVGMATNIAPHNLREVAAAVNHLIAHPDCTVHDLIQFVQGPDFPTGGLICGRAGILEAYATGRGMITVRARIHEEETKSSKVQLVVTEIPYMVTKTRIIEKIADAVKDGRITGISDIRDESDREGMRLVIELKRGENQDVILNQLYKHSPLQGTFSANTIALVNSRPEMLTLKQLLENFRDYRMEVIRRRTRFLLDKAEKRAHVLEGLLIALQNIDEVIEIIKTSQTTQMAAERLRERFGLTEVQTDAILQMRLARLTGLEQEKLREEHAQLMMDIERYKAILADDNLVLELIQADMKDVVDRYGDDRRTEIIGDVEEFVREDLIPEEMQVVMMSHEGYIKRLPVDTYRAQGRGGRGVTAADTKEGDFLRYVLFASTHDYLLFFSDDGIAYPLKVYEIPQASRQAKGRSIANLLEIEKDRSVTWLIPVSEFAGGDLVFATRDGTVKRTPLEAFKNIRKRGIRAINLENEDHLMGVNVAGEGDFVVLATRQGMSIRFALEDVRAMGRAAQGVRGIQLKKGDSVAGMVVSKEGSGLLTVCERGYGKRTELAEYRVQRRGGKGIINIKVNERNGEVVSILDVVDEDELVMITKGGMAVRTAVAGFRLIGRATQGVILIRVGDDDRVVSVAKVVREDDDETPGEVEATADPGGDA
jgi:DNA gyrase subunit A